MRGWREFEEREVDEGSCGGDGCTEGGMEGRRERARDGGGMMARLKRARFEAYNCPSRSAFPSPLPPSPSLPLPPSEWIAGTIIPAEQLSHALSKLGWIAMRDVKGEVDAGVCVCLCVCFNV